MEVSVVLNIDSWYWFSGGSPDFDILSVSFHGLVTLVTATSHPPDDFMSSCIIRHEHTLCLETNGIDKIMLGKHASM